MKIEQNISVIKEEISKLKTTSEEFMSEQTESNFDEIPGRGKSYDAIKNNDTKTKEILTGWCKLSNCIIEFLEEDIEAFENANK